MKNMRLACLIPEQPELRLIVVFDVISNTLFYEAPKIVYALPGIKRPLYGYAIDWYDSIARLSMVLTPTQL
jgi:hypothetical protein